jgi:hypothetical protein
MKRKKIMGVVNGDRFLEAMGELSVAELAARTGISESTVRNFQHSVATSPHRPSRRVLKLLDQVLKFTHEHYMEYPPQPVTVDSGLFDALAICSALPVEQLRMAVPMDFTGLWDARLRLIGEGMVHGRWSDTIALSILQTKEQVTISALDPEGAITHNATVLLPNEGDTTLDAERLASAGEAADPQASEADTKAQEASANMVKQTVGLVLLNAAGPPLGFDRVANQELPSGWITYCYGDSHLAGHLVVVVPLGPQATGVSLQIRVEIEARRRSSDRPRNR